jgi:hypothetical protein
MEQQPENPAKNTNARIALVIALIGLVAPFIGLFAVYLGRKAIEEIDREKGGMTGRGAASAAGILGMVETAAFCLLLVMGVILPMLNKAFIHPRPDLNRRQMRGIHQQMIVFAESNKGWYPGLTATGALDGTAVVSLRDASLGRLRREDFYSKEYLVSPAEVDSGVNGFAITGVATSTGSYAVLEYADKKRPLASPSMLGNLEWRESLNSTAIVMSDRELTTSTGEPRSIWTSVNDQWSGYLVFSDNHAEFVETDKGYTGLYGNAQKGAETGIINNLFDLTAGDGQMTTD